MHCAYADTAEREELRAFALVSIFGLQVQLLGDACLADHTWQLGGAGKIQSASMGILNIFFFIQRELLQFKCTCICPKKRILNPLAGMWRGYA